MIDYPKVKNDKSLDNLNFQSTLISIGIIYALHRKFSKFKTRIVLMIKIWTRLFVFICILDFVIEQIKGKKNEIIKEAS